MHGLCMRRVSWCASHAAMDTKAASLTANSGLSTFQALTNSGQSSRLRIATSITEPSTAFGM
jgi:hypothetical protein